jgi:hypothetical protein
VKLSQLLEAHQQKLTITPVHEKWLAEHPNAEYSDEAKAFLADQIGKPDRKRTESLSPSSAGKCLRRRQFEFLGLPRRSFRTSLIQVLHNGTWVHLRWQAAGLSAGWLDEPEVPVAYPELMMKGTMDGRLVDGRGLEIKSINSNGFRYVMKHGPKREHQHQVTSYALASHIDEWVMLYEDKDTNEYREFLFIPSPEGLYAVRHEYEKLVSAILGQRLIEMKDECWAKQGSEYLQCPYRDVCPLMKSWDQACESSVTTSTGTNPSELPSPAQSRLVMSSTSESGTKSTLRVRPTSSSPNE